jgi:hypothetical protein
MSKPIGNHRLRREGSTAEEDREEANFCDRVVEDQMLSTHDRPTNKMEVRKSMRWDRTARVSKISDLPHEESQRERHRSSLIPQQFELKVL